METLLNNMENKCKGGSTFESHNLDVHHLGVCSKCGSTNIIPTSLSLLSLMNTEEKFEELYNKTFPNRPINDLYRWNLCELFFNAGIKSLNSSRESEPITEEKVLKMGFVKPFPEYKIYNKEPYQLEHQDKGWVFFINENASDNPISRYVENMDELTELYNILEKLKTNQ